MDGAKRWSANPRLNSAGRIWGHVVYPEGMITLTTTIGKSPKSRTIQVNLTIVKVDRPYNMLLGRPILNALKAIISTYNLSLNFLTPARVTEINNNVRMLRECYLATMQAAFLANLSSRTLPQDPNFSGLSSSGTQWEDSALTLDTIEPRYLERLQRLETGDEVEEMMLNYKHLD